MEWKAKGMYFQSYNCKFTWNNSNNVCNRDISLLQDEEEIVLFSFYLCLKFVFTT